MSGTLQSIGAQAATIAYRLAFEVSPIILANGIAAGSVGGMLPIIGLTGQLAAFGQSALLGGGLSLDSFFAHYVPIPGATIISQAAGQYPFANQQVASNATIQQPLNLSMLMMCPVQNDAGYVTKLPILSSLWASLKNHNLLGGVYHVATPANIFMNGLLLNVAAVDSGESKQQQINFQLDFYFPLITQQQAKQAQSNLMQTATNGGQISGAPSWTGSGGVGGINIAGMPAAITSFLSSPVTALGSVL